MSDETVTIPADDYAVIVDGLRSMRRKHIVVDDCWYSCPDFGHCCDERQPGNECCCGAARHNAMIEDLLAILGEPS